ncbi:c-type cytochrome [Ramlibacter rhizophilus]|uniref:Cytochrome c5 family protein n=1 Tax=Ramlibacter rhizophilus TaxID=1781167 RepID=A0A4Z0BEL7_9BURK|nr:c-type cytochrome [Ramlibacter rhizophilus]TFY97785.1 cytochrome c5 family protein [Ramlibacter rhizophilus]
MSDSTQQEEAHSGPIKTPVQLLWAAFFAFVVPVIIIIGLVAYVVSDTKPAGSQLADRHVLGGLSAEDLERNVAARIQKVGTVEIRDANRPLQAGEAVFKAQCAACHVAGVAGAPKVGDTAGWAARIQTGFDALVAAALKGKGAMPAQAGGDFEDLEIARAVAYLANTGGGKFAEPNRPEGGAAQSAAAGPAAAVPGSQANVTMTATPPLVAMAPNPAAGANPPAAPAAPAAAPAAPAAAPVAAGAGEALYKQACMACHAAGVAGAPKLGDKSAWAPRLSAGVDGLLQSVVKGKGAMPPKGGAAAATEAQLRAAVEYMVGTVK